MYWQLIDLPLQVLVTHLPVVRIGTNLVAQCGEEHAAADGFVWLEDVDYRILTDVLEASSPRSTSTECVDVT